STVLFDALRAGQIDVAVDYTGTLYANVLQRDLQGRTRQQIYDDVSSELGAEHGIDVVGGLGFENAYTLALRQNQAASLGITSLADLAPHAASLSVAGDF